MKQRIISIGVAFLMLFSLLVTQTMAAGLPFTDVPATAWYYSDVKNAYETGLINGRNDTTFAPKANMTYAEAIKLAACMHQKYTTGAVTLKNGSPWYQTYVDYAKNTGIIWKDYAWTQHATRAGYIEIFAHALPNTALGPINTVKNNAIPDVPVTHPQADAIYKLYRAGILEGTGSDHACKPDNTINRAEVAAILTRMMDPSARKTFTLTVAGEKTAEDILQAMKDTRDFSAKWFYDGPGHGDTHADCADTIQGPYLGGTWTYAKVTQSGINTRADVVTLAQQYYTRSAAEEIVGYKQWIEQNGKLYVSMPEGLGGGYTDEMYIVMEKSGTGQYTLKCSEYMFGEFMFSYEMHYTFMNGRWVFDTPIYLLPPTIHVVDFI